MGVSLGTIIKAGVSGACSIFLVCTGIVLLVPGIALSVGMTVRRGVPIFQGTDYGTRLGNSILGIAMLFLSIGFLLWCYACKKVERKTNKRSHQGVVYSQTPVAQQLVPQPYPITNNPSAGPPMYPPQMINQQAYPQQQGPYPTGFPQNNYVQPQITGEYPNPPHYPIGPMQDDMKNAY